MRYLILIVALCNPLWASAKSFAEGKRYLCNIKSAAGWAENGDPSQLEIITPDTQYVIEPTVQTFSIPQINAEGFREMTASHTIKQLGEEKQAAVCSKSWMDDTMFCHTETSVYGPEVEDGVLITPRFMIYQVEEKTFILKDNTFTEFFTRKLDIYSGRTSVEAGTCTEF